MRVRFDLRSLEKGWQRVSFYLGNFTRYFLPSWIFRLAFQMRLRLTSPATLAQAQALADYYCRGSSEKDVCPEPQAKRGNGRIPGPGGRPVAPVCTSTVGKFRYPWSAKKKYTTYFFDLFEAVRVFPPESRFSWCFGDVDFTFPGRVFAKARPVGVPETENTVLMPLNKVRHMRFVRDRRTWREKKDMLVFRNVVNLQPWRTAFLKACEGSPICDAGQINPCPEHPEWQKPYMPMEEMLGYKFIAAIEGHDVASNLKWVMSSNSIAVMPRPTVESWFREGTLVGGYHYIEVKPDYSDLEEKLHYYLAHPDEAEEIISHAHEYVAPFRSRSFQRLTARLTARKYFSLSSEG